MSNFKNNISDSLELNYFKPLILWNENEEILNLIKNKFKVKEVIDNNLNNDKIKIVIIDKTKKEIDEINYKINLESIIK